MKEGRKKDGRYEVKGGKNERIKGEGKGTKIMAQEVGEK